MTLRTGWAWLCGAIALAMCCTACASPADEVRASATKAARAAAEKGFERLRESPAPTRDSVTQAAESIVANGPDQTTLIAKDIPGSGHFTVDIAFLSLVGNGYSGEYVQVAVRLCVSYTGELERPGSISIADRFCPAGLPVPLNGTPVDREIKLNG